MVKASHSGSDVPTYGHSDIRTVLGVESSCDETAVALYSSERGLICNNVYSQYDLHKEYGGVVPELASRDHVRKLLPLIDQTLQKNQVNKKQLSAVAYTQGPGLIGALLVGSTLAKSLAWGLNIPAIGIHHIEAHLMAAFLDQGAEPKYPFVTLLVSGGHSLLVYVKAFGDYEILGQSLDDAAGEAFDKVAKLLKLEYATGAALAKLADQGDPEAFDFPRPMTKQPGLDMSFSGLKTAVRTVYQKQLLDVQTSGPSDLLTSNIAASFQAAVVDTLVIKCKRALEQTGCERLIVAGGVSANRRLRQLLSEQLPNTEVLLPKLQYCTDNAAMVAYTGYCRLVERGEQDQDLAVRVKPRWPLN